MISGLLYSNQAYAKLMETELQELLKKNFTRYFPKADRKRLKYYYETAYKGIAHVISCQELQKSREEIQRVRQRQQIWSFNIVQRPMRSA